MKKISEAEFNKAQKLIEDYKKQKQSLKFEKEIEDFAIDLRKAYDECSIRYENKQDGNDDEDRSEFDKCMPTTVQLSVMNYFGEHIALITIEDDEEQVHQILLQLVGAFPRSTKKKTK